MKWLVILFALVSVAVASESHSIEKRTTTVTMAKTWQDVFAAVTNMVVSFFLVVIIWLFVAPLFGIATHRRAYKPYSYQQTYQYPEQSYQYQDSGYQYEQPQYYGYQSRGFQDTGVIELAAKALNSIDMVDTTFNVMDVESEVCRKRAVCEVESVASSNPLFSLVVNTVNSNLRGLERYSDAVEAGLGGEDCALAYDECPHSFLEQLPTFF